MYIRIAQKRCEIQTGRAPTFLQLQNKLYFCSGFGTVIVVDAFIAKMVDFILKMLYFDLLGLKIPMESKICQNHIQNTLGLTAQPQDVWVF